MAGVFVAGVFIAGLVLWGRETSGDPVWMRPAPWTTPVVPAGIAKGGSARVAVSTPPEIDDDGQGGVTLRQLVLPQLFTAQPDGTWMASLVEPGTDHGARDARSAHFRFRENARWSNGNPITVADLRRSVDSRMVASVDDPRSDGTIVVHFTHPLANWRRLWSGDDTVAAPAAGVWGGPFVVQSIVSGLETVVVPNPQWYGSEPYLASLHLVLVPDSVTARQLLAGNATNAVDVMVPPMDIGRLSALRALRDVSVGSDIDGGTWAGLVFNPQTLPASARARIVNDFPRKAFVESLLNGEATVLNGLVDSHDVTWKQLPKAVAGSFGAPSIRLTTTPGDQISVALERSLQLVIRNAGGTTVLDDADESMIRQWFNAGTYDVALVTGQFGPTACWQCSWTILDPASATLGVRADGGDDEAALSLESKLRDQMLFLPLWRPVTVAAWRSNAVNGVAANGFSIGAAWNADRWWVKAW